MNKIYISSLLLLSAISYSQKKIEPGTYIATNEGQDIKLRLTEDKKYELVIFYGDYEIKNDTLSLGNNGKTTSDFVVFLSSEANPAPGKVKVQLTGKHASMYASSIYIGTQSGKANPVFNNLSEFSSETNYDENELNFEIDRADFFYLVKEDYDGKTTLEKYALPRTSNQITFQYTPNFFGKVKLQGFYNEKDELVIADKGQRNPLLFLPENQKKPALKSDIVPLETKTETNWTYVGKKDIYDNYGAVDSAYASVSNYKLIIQNSLSKAIEATKKMPSKFLVISYDPDNKNAKSEFDQFVKSQEYSIGTYMSYENNTEYDKYNYYLATEKDKSWFAKNKITDKPSTIVLDSDGNILSQTKGSVATNSYLFEVYYSSISEGLKQVKAMSELNTAINSKAKENEILKKMLPLSEGNSGWEIYPPLSAQSGIIEPPIVKEVVQVTEPIQEVAVDTAIAYSDYYSQNEPIYTKINFDKKKLLATWDKIVKSHEKDSKPDMDFVKVALAEIHNKGFYNKIYSEERLFDETNFKAIDYLMKHYDAILVAQNTKKASDTLGLDYDYNGTIDYSLQNAVMMNGYLVTSETSSDYQKRILGIYKKLMEKQSGNSNMTVVYFNALEVLARNSNAEVEYVSEYDSFFNKAYKGTNEIEILNDLYSEKAKDGLNYEDWSGFKNSYSNASNQAAWFVVEKSTNPESIKKAIKWSESSLRIEKNNPYYLDTLAQLYYKNGEKQKAITTQEQALKYAKESNLDRETIYESSTTFENMKNVLENMKKGTY